NLRHVDRDGASHGAELGGVLRRMRDLRAPNLIFAGQTIDIRTRAPDIPALHDSSLSPRSRHIPSQELATRSTAKNQDFVVFRLRHVFPPCIYFSVILMLRQIKLSLFMQP